MELEPRKIATPDEVGPAGPAAGERASPPRKPRAKAVRAKQENGEAPATERPAEGDFEQPQTSASIGEPRAREPGGDRARRLGLLGRLRRIVAQNLFSSLTRRIVFLNLAALAVLLSGILYLNQFREGLIDARVESLLIQGRIIASAIAASASVETDAITIDPDQLIELQAGETTLILPDPDQNLDSPIRPEMVAPLLQRLIRLTRTRARIYDRDGHIILDSRFLYAGGQASRGEEPGMIDRIGMTLSRLLQGRSLPVYRELPPGGPVYPEVNEALISGPSTVVRMSEQGELIVSVALPIQRFRSVLGVLLLSTQGGDIDRIVAEERIAIMRVFLVASIVTIILSILLASTIANPLRKLSEAAKRVRTGVKSRVEIPDFYSRQDEIGNLSKALRDMTGALYARIEAIERFAADVSHELKNPLTSLRSAAETLPLAKTADAKARLMEVIQDDVRRLDRLITDISDASRLDAELARIDASVVAVDELVKNVAAASREIKHDRGQLAIEVMVAPTAGSKSKYWVAGHTIRLGQVMHNLVDNARSFVPEDDGRIEIAMARRGERIEITVTDNGPGIPAENRERVFERFYTDREHQNSFGRNSGLGLSISRQIIEAHGGSIVVTDRPDGQTGARFVINLPAEDAPPADE